MDTTLTNPTRIANFNAIESDNNLYESYYTQNIAVNVTGDYLYGVNENNSNVIRPQINPALINPNLLNPGRSTHSSALNDPSRTNVSSRSADPSGATDLTCAAKLPGASDLSVSNDVFGQSIPSEHVAMRPIRFAAGGKKLSRAIERELKIQVTSPLALDSVLPQTVSVRIGRPRVLVKSFLFGASDKLCNEKKIGVPESPDALGAGGTADQELPVVSSDLNPEDVQKRRPKNFTRLKPPQDLIKLEDRLKYLLQPPLEQLFTSKELKFPFEPFPYQWQGIGFLFPRHAAVLADEMGLGKTMQAITTVRLMIRSGAIRSVLLVCPKPLVTNWKREFDVWAPEIPVEIIEGDHARRKWIWELQDTPVKIANYELLHRDRLLYSPPPVELIDDEGNKQFVRGGVKFDLVVLDEAQRIKNQGGSTHKAVQAIQRRRSWALTGTPVENCANDLVGIFEWLSPGYLSTQMKPSEMGRAIGDHILRRTKDKVLTDMPPKMVRDTELEMLPSQKESYNNAEENGVEQINDMGEEASIQHVLQLITKLKQICNFDPVTGESPKVQRLVADMEEVAASGQKAIVFSQWTQTIDQMKPYLAPFCPLEYSGRIPHSQRDSVIQRFKENPEHKVILMTYGAGSVGLNLQFCNYVFLFDRWWNPAIEDQAINRAHRIGVKGSVTVSRFLLMGTIEERIDKVLREKRELFDTILSGADACTKSGMTQKEIFGLFNLKIQNR